MLSVGNNAANVDKYGKILKERESGRWCEHDVRGQPLLLDIADVCLILVNMCNSSVIISS